MPDVPDIGKVPTGPGNVNKPASGTYGEKTELANLKASLPPMDPNAGPGGQKAQLPPIKPMVTPTPGNLGGRPAGASAPPGVPAPIVAPTTRPEVPVTTPLSDSVAAPVPDLDAAGRRLQILDLLANSPDVSESTREWASRVLKALVG